MKEYILLTFIASVGLSGLFSIHHEVQALDDQVLYFDEQVFSRLSVRSSKRISNEPSQLVIDQVIIWPQIVVEITNFDPASMYYLDTGDGGRIKVSARSQVLSYHHSGVVLLKLLKDNTLIDVIELAVEAEGKATAKLVSY
jgi:hypothetical protein